MFSEKVHRFVFLFGIISAPFGLMLGRFPGSLPIVILAANFLLEGKFKNKWNLLKGNLLYFTLSALFLINLLGLIHSNNLNEGVNEIRIALPLLFFPLVLLSSAPLSKSEINYVLYSFIAGTFLDTAWCIVYGYIIHNIELGRDLSRFMSHIRLGLFINLVIACCIYFLWQTKSIRLKLMWMALMVYFIAILFLMGLASGILILFLLIVMLVIRLIFERNKIFKLLGIVSVSLLLAAGTFYIKTVRDEQLSISNSDYNQLKRVNNFGRPLIHFDSLGVVENGNYVLRNIQLEDLKKTWNERVPLDSFSFQPENNLNRYYVILRYLSSAKLGKDAQGINALTNEDIEQIKKNVTNCQFPKWSFLHKRIYELVNEYDDFKNGREVNGHSLAMRTRFWKASFILIQNNICFGVGNGDVQDELDKIYKKYFPEINFEFYKRPHNQFLTFTVAFGLFGILIFMWVLIYPAIYLRKYLSNLYWVFLFILLCSFVTEDTLGTQAGMGFYAIFNTLFCVDAFFRKQQNLEDLQGSH